MLAQSRGDEIESGLDSSAGVNRIPDVSIDSSSFSVYSAYSAVLKSAFFCVICGYKGLFRRFTAEQAVDDAVDEGVPTGLDHIGGDADGRPLLMPVGRDDDDAYFGCGSLAGVDHAD